MLSQSVKAAGVALLLAACADPAGVRQDSIEVQMDAAGLSIHNGRSGSIYIFASEAQTAARIDWVLCTDPPNCHVIPPGTTRQFDKSKIVGWGESNEVILWWWHLVPATEGGFQADSVRAIFIRDE